MIRTLKITAIVLFVAYWIIANYCRFKDAIGLHCKSQERVTSVAKTECPLSLERHDSLSPQQPRREMRL